ncbi:MAG: hypothetical protein QOG62_1273 [Thermoleophilaceae bacterium]|jgi:hypothetical protein|nr:hypothetical protein [Thermoleophilaceae bacterium]
MATAVRNIWRALSPEQRVAGVGAVLLIVSTFGPFSFVEGAEILVALAILLLIFRRAQGRRFHLPFGDGTIIALGGVWCTLLVLVRLFNRPFAQAVFALGCCALIFAAGVRERTKRPADDMPSTRGEPTWLDDDPPGFGRGASRRRPPREEDLTAPLPSNHGVTRPLPRDEDLTEPLPGDQRTLPLPTERPDLPDVDEPPELKL